MNRGQRYEPLPQRDDNPPSHQQPIILSPMPSYNYNTGIPTSVASSSAAPSVISVPNSPPPSFHTHSSPGTPRPSQQQLHQAFDHGAFLNGTLNRGALRGGRGSVTATEAELWGIAPSTVGGETLGEVEGLTSSNDVLGTIKGLKQRVEWLEESLGRLLLEKEKLLAGAAGRSQERNNCCVSFTDASPDLERAFTSNQHHGQNCCVSFSGSYKTDAKRKEQRLALAAVLFITLVICFTIGVVMTARAGRVNRAVNGAVDHVTKFLE